MKRQIPLTYRAGIALAFGAALISGIAVYLNGFAVRSAPSALSFTTAKNVVAAAIIGAVICLGSTRKQFFTVLRSLNRNQWLALAYVGVVSGGLAFGLFFQGLAQANSTQAAFTQKSLIIWVALLAVPLLGERIGARQIVAIALLIGGQILLVGTVFSGKAGTLGALVLILIATLIWAVEIILVRRFLRTLPAALLGGVRMGVGAVVLIVWLTASSGLGDLGRLGSSGWGWALLTGVILSGYVLTWFGALRRAEAVDVTAILVVGAFITAILGMPAASVVTAAQVLGLILVGVGAFVVVRPRSDRTAGVRSA